MMGRMRMNHADGKRLLAAVRDGDFAHAGEEAAVRMAWRRLPKRPNQSCLDAGCGRGGSAALVQSQGWGQVIGLDIDAETISFAQTAYPDVRFVPRSYVQENFSPLSSTSSMRSMPSMHFRSSKLRSARSGWLGSPMPLSACLITLTEADSAKHVSRKNLRRCSGVRYR
jgi:SAM-dependent methyltransferase